MTQGLEDPQLSFLMRHLSLHWHLKMMVGLWQLAPVTVELYSMIFGGNYSLLLFFVLIVVQRSVVFPVFIIFLTFTSQTIRIYCGLHALPDSIFPLGI